MTSPCSPPALTPMDRPTRTAKPFTDPFTARAGGSILLVIAAGEFFVGVKALFSGCIRTMRGRHGTAVLHCTPDRWYWAHTAIALFMGTALIIVVGMLLRYARRPRKQCNSSVHDQGDATNRRRIPPR